MNIYGALTGLILLYLHNDGLHPSLIYYALSGLPKIQSLKVCQLTQNVSIKMISPHKVCQLTQSVSNKMILPLKVCQLTQNVSIKMISPTKNINIQ